MTKAARDIVVFDLGGVLIDWDPCCGEAFPKPRECAAVAGVAGVSGLGRAHYVCGRRQSRSRAANQSGGSPSSRRPHTASASHNLVCVTQQSRRSRARQKRGDAVRCAVEVQREMAERNTGVSPDGRIEFRMGINLGDIIKDGRDIYGDGVNVAARLEALAEPGGICVSRVVRDQVRDKLAFSFEDMGEQQVKNIARPVRVHRIVLSEGTGPSDQITGGAADPPLTLPDKPSIAVLPFHNMSGDLEQEYFADGMVEEIITALSRIRWLFVIARNSTFTFKGQAVDVKQVGRELGVRYVLEGSVRKAAPAGTRLASGAF
jgi:class 3 adenylate cyclase